MLRLFGAPSQARLRRLRGGRARWRTAGEERVELYQLLPLLVHALLFGGSYAARPSGSPRRYAG